MNRYEDQPADLLLRDLFDLGVKGMRTVDDEMEYNEDIVAIKIAVVREASMGSFIIKSNPEYERPQSHMITWKNCPYDEGTYACVPIKDTP